MATDQRTEPSIDDLEESYNKPSATHPLGSRESNVYDQDRPVASGSDLKAAEEQNMGVQPGSGGGRRKFDWMNGGFKKDEGKGETDGPSLAGKENDSGRRFDWMNGGFYKGGGHEGPGDHTKFMQQKVGGKKGAGSFLNRHKKALILAGGVGGGAIGFFAIMVVLILILAPYKTVHFATILRSVGLARFTYVMNKQFSRTIFDSAVLTQNSTGRFKPPETSLFYKVVGINPTKQLKQLGNDNIMRFDFEGNNIWGGALGRTNSFRGVVVGGQGYYLDDYAYKMYGRANYDDLTRAEARRVRASFALDVHTHLSDALQLKNRRFRWGVYKGFYAATGIKLLKWAKKGEDYKNLSEQEARSKNVDDNLKQVEGADAKARTSGLSEIDAAAEAKRKATIDAAKNNTAPGEVRSKLAERVRGVRGLSSAVAVITLACVVHSLANAFKDAQPQREQQAARMAFETQTAAAQTTFGDTQNPAVGAENAMWDQADHSPIYKQVTGQPLSSSDQASLTSVASIKTPDQTFQSIIGLVDQIMTAGPLDGVVPGVGSVKGKVLNGLCDVLLNEYVQDAEALAEIVISVASAGSTEGVVAAIRAGVEGGVEFGASVGLGELIGDLIDGMVGDLSNMSFSGIETGPTRFDDAFVATSYSSEVGNRQITFGAPMDYDGVTAAQQQAMADLHTENARGSFTERYFALDNPFSLTSNLVATMPSSFTGVAESMRSNLASVISVVGSPQRLLGNLLGVFTSRNHAFAASVSARKDLYGIESWGWTVQEQDRVDSDVSFDIANPEHNDLIHNIEPKLDELNAKYGPCYDAGFVLQTQRPKECTKAFLTTDEALHWRVYMSYTYASVHLAGSV